MNGSTKETLARELRTELRSIIRMLHKLSDALQPITTVTSRSSEEPRYLLLADDFAMAVRWRGVKLNAETLSFPEEQFTDVAYDAARAVWHFRDRLYLWCDESKQPRSIVDLAVNSSEALRVCHDLVTFKKHRAVTRPKSTHSPRIGLTKLDLRKAGPVEFGYQGDRKHKVLFVSKHEPVPIKVEVLNGTNGEVIGDAYGIVMWALLSWIPCIETLAILLYENPEADYILSWLDTAKHAFANLTPQPKSPECAIT